MSIDLRLTTAESIKLASLYAEATPGTVNLTGLVNWVEKKSHFQAQLVREDVGRGGPYWFLVFQNEGDALLCKLQGIEIFLSSKCPP